MLWVYVCAVPGVLRAARSNPQGAAHVLQGSDGRGSYREAPGRLDGRAKQAMASVPFIEATKPELPRSPDARPPQQHRDAHPIDARRRDVGEGFSRDRIDHGSPRHDSSHCDCFRRDRGLDPVGHWVAVQQSLARTDEGPDGSRWDPERHLHGGVVSFDERNPAFGMEDWFEETTQYPPGVRGAVLQRWSFEDASERFVVRIDRVPWSRCHCLYGARYIGTSRRGRQPSKWLGSDPTLPRWLDGKLERDVGSANHELHACFWERALRGALGLLGHFRRRWCCSAHRRHLPCGLLQGDLHVALSLCRHGRHCPHRGHFGKPCGVCPAAPSLHRGRTQRLARLRARGECSLRRCRGTSLSRPGLRPVPHGRA